MSWNFKTATTDLKDGFAPVTEGRYTMAIEDAEIKTASTGTTMLQVTLVINGDGDFKNRKVWKSFALDKPKSMRYVIDFLKAAGTNVWEQDNVTNEDLIKAVKGSAGVNAYLTPGKTNNGNDITNADKFMSIKEGEAVAGGSNLFS
tara:strand:- start:3178 stop:3615 length:438 start_codon:yes stop_codon:yes gene_type:complete